MKFEFKWGYTPKYDARFNELGELFNPWLHRYNSILRYFGYMVGKVAYPDGYIEENKYRPPHAISSVIKELEIGLKHYNLNLNDEVYREVYNLEGWKTIIRELYNEGYLVKHPTLERNDGTPWLCFTAEIYNEKTLKRQRVYKLQSDYERSYAGRIDKLFYDTLKNIANVSYNNLLGAVFHKSRCYASTVEYAQNALTTLEKYSDKYSFSELQKLILEYATEILCSEKFPNSVFENREYVLNYASRADIDEPVGFANIVAVAISLGLGYSKKKISPSEVEYDTDFIFSDNTYRGLSEFRDSVRDKGLLSSENNFSKANEDFLRATSLFEEVAGVDLDDQAMSYGLDLRNPDIARGCLKRNAEWAVRLSIDNRYSAYGKALYKAYSPLISLDANVANVEGMDRDAIREYSRLQKDKFLEFKDKYGDLFR
jgi:hypothetical protein